ncbi:hypothetical protein TCA2_4398 [Paenibacillus sp. TCA20]|nr:hypothetical protein TCA2_4398 [Paenibacillus sp. TCA20]
MKKLFLSALLTLGVLSATAGAASAAECVEPVVYKEDTLVRPLAFGWGS